MQIYYLKSSAGQGLKWVSLGQNQGDCGATLTPEGRGKDLFAYFVHFLEAACAPWFLAHFSIFKASSVGSSSLSDTDHLLMLSHLLL